MLTDITCKVVVPNVQSIEQLVSERSIPVGEHADVADLCAIDAVEDAVLAELNAVAKKAGLKSLEMLQCIILTPYEWTTENGLLTAGTLVTSSEVEEELISDCRVALQRRSFRESQLFTSTELKLMYVNVQQCPATPSLMSRML